MKIDNVYKVKSLDRLDLAEWQIKQNKIDTLGSTLYFALFNFMQAILKEAPEGKWKHIGINKMFSKFCIENNCMDRLNLRKIYNIYTDLYILRIKADYTNEKLTKKEKLELLAIFEFISEVIRKWQQ